MSQSNAVPQQIHAAREEFLQLVAELRPELHRYCARVVGSVVDGEEIVQETLARSFYALGMATELPPLRPWLFRVAHNTALDFLKRYEHKHVEARADFDDTAVDEAPMDPAVLRAALSTFLTLPVAQRSAVILKDVLGHSLEETAETMALTIPAVKSALSRGRASLRARGAIDDAPAVARIDPAERARLQRYVTLFNTRDWDGLKALLTDECQLDLVAKSARRGREIHGYFGRYAAEPDARVAIGTVEGRPALAFLPREGAPPAYFIFLGWSGDQVSFIQDFRYVPYIAADAAIRIETESFRPAHSS